MEGCRQALQLVLSRSAMLFPDFPDVPFGDEGEDFDYLDYLITFITTVNTCLRYLVERRQEA